MEHHRSAAALQTSPCSPGPGQAAGMLWCTQEHLSHAAGAGVLFPSRCLITQQQCCGEMPSGLGIVELSCGESRLHSSPAIRHEIMEVF